MPRSLRLVLAAATMATLGLAAGGIRVAHAYPPPPASGTLTATCTNTSLGQQCHLVLTVVNPNGTAASGVLAAFSSSGCGSVSPTSGVTDSSGQASTTFTAGAGCCGPSTVTATASDGASAQTDIGVKCSNAAAAAGTAGLSSLPNTGVLPSLPSGGGSPRWAWALLVGFAALLMASMTTFRLARRRA